ncbi:MAG TPA: hypothetical protein VE994_10685, partial [Terriglobales bacterium]|nr:hypothetical protein [Terriglobales bacterium]
MSTADLKAPTSATPSTDVPSTPAWFRFLMPSVADLLFLLLMALFLFTPLQQRLLGDAGTGWHIRDGQHIVITDSLPHTDSFSYTVAGKKWYAWEWLYDLLAWDVFARLGLNGVVFFSVFIIALTFALLFRYALRESHNLPITLVLVLLSISGSMIHLLARPHLITWLLTLVFFVVLERSDSRPHAPAPGLFSGAQRRLLWLPFLMLLWVNLHGGFVVGLMLITLFLIGTLWSAFSSHDRRHVTHAIGRAKSLSVTLVASGFATLVNPYGYKLYLHLNDYLSNKFFMDHIDEFLSPNFHGVAQKCFEVLLLLSVFAIAISRRRLRLTHLLVILFAIHASLFAARNIPISSILLTLTIAPLLAHAIGTAGRSEELTHTVTNFLHRFEAFSGRVSAMELSLRGHIIPIAFTVFAFTVCANGGWIGARQVMNAHFDAKKFPVGAAEFIARQGIHDKVFNPDS